MYNNLIKKKNYILKKNINIKLLNIKIIIII